jgi:hypothetical protein
MKVVCQPYTTAALTPQETFLVLISFRDWVDSKAIVQTEGLRQWKIPMTLSGKEPATFRLVVQCPMLYVVSWTKLNATCAVCAPRPQRLCFSFWITALQEIRSGRCPTGSINSARNTIKTALCSLKDTTILIQQLYKPVPQTSQFGNKWSTLPSQITGRVMIQLSLTTL